MTLRGGRFGLRVIDVNEMWGNSDYIQKLIIEKKDSYIDLENLASWYCKNRFDSIKGKWVVERLNKQFYNKKVLKEDVIKAIYKLSKIWTKNRIRLEKNIVIKWPSPNGERWMECLENYQIDRRYRKNI